MLLTVAQFWVDKYIRSNYNELLNNPKNIILSDEAKLALPKEPTIDEIKQYSYNSQTDILVSSDEYGFFYN